MNDHETGTNEDIERLAGELHENIRALNHLTQGPPGLSEPAAAYSVLGNLAQTSFRLAQTAEHIDTCLTRELDAGRLGHDQGEEPALALTTVHNALARAAEQATELGDSFRHATGALAPIHALDAGDTAPLPELQTAENVDERNDPQAETAQEGFPRPIGDALSHPGPIEDTAPIFARRHKCRTRAGNVDREDREPAVVVRRQDRETTAAFVEGPQQRNRDGGPEQMP